jgi:hypothetical protein
MKAQDCAAGTDCSGVCEKGDGGQDKTDAGKGVEEGGRTSD